MVFFKKKKDKHSNIENSNLQKSKDNNSNTNDDINIDVNEAQNNIEKQELLKTNQQISNEIQDNIENKQEDIDKNLLVEDGKDNITDSGIQGVESGNSKYNFQTSNQKKSSNLLETLIAKGILTKDQIKIAELQSQKTGDGIIDILIKLNFVTESVIHSVFENTNNEKSKINLVEMVPDMDLINAIPISFALEHKVMPIKKQDDKIIIATSNPYDIVLLEQVSSLFKGKTVEATPYSEAELISAIDKFYKGNVIANLADILNEMEINVDNVKREDITKTNTPIVKFINALIYEAIKCKASDIHIEPDEAFVRIRMRIDGILMNKTIVHKHYWSGICVRIKVLAGMNIAESRKPQDGAMKMTVQGREIDFRVSSIPTLYGENIVIRVLDKTQGLMTLEELGFNNTNLKLIKLSLEKPEGIVIVTGPTGSGKTTTLYSILSMINKIEDNIMTLEEPVEYRLPMIRQSEINHRSGFDFATGLRSLLRQDPDIIFLGEIRDQETAEIATRASITGHKVFSTLHTNSALSAITRLIDMGIKTYMLSDSLNMVIAQRLARRLCQDCKKEEIMTNKMKEVFLLNKDKEYKIYSACGCEKCNQTGYRGRIVISEVLFVDEAIKNIISEKPTMSAIIETANKQGFIPMQRDAILKLVKGLTSLEEIKRVVDITNYTKDL